MPRLTNKNNHWFHLGWCAIFTVNHVFCSCLWFIGARILIAHCCHCLHLNFEMFCVVFFICYFCLNKWFAFESNVCNVQCVFGLFSLNKFRFLLICLVLIAVALNIEGLHSQRYWRTIECSKQNCFCRYLIWTNPITTFSYWMTFWMHKSSSHWRCTKCFPNSKTSKTLSNIVHTFWMCTQMICLRLHYVSFWCNFKIQMRT